MSQAFKSRKIIFLGIFAALLITSISVGVWYVKSTAAPRNGLVAYWDMDANNINGTTYFDKSGQGNHATSTGSPTIGTGKIGEALDLNGSSQRLEVLSSDSLNFGTDEFTISAWIKLDEVALTQHAGIIEKGDNSEVAGEWVFQVLADANSNYINFRTGATSRISGNTTVTKGVWHHVVVTRTGTSIYGYLDGVLDDTGSGASDNLTNTETVRIGWRSPIYDGYFPGLIDEVRIWKRVFTTLEVKKLYESTAITHTDTIQRSGAGGDLSLDLKMGNNDGQATPKVYDSSGNGRHATSTNAQTSNGSFCDFNGTNDSMTGVGTGVFNGANVGIAIKFRPDFNYDEDATRTLFDSTAASEYALFKMNDAANNTLRLYLGNTQVEDIASATYSQYWKVNEDNIIIISGTTGNTDLWLNGIKILDADNTAWTPDDPATYYIGTDSGSSLFFDGRVYYVKVLNRLLTDNEVYNLSQDRTKASRTFPRNGLIGYWNMDLNDINGTTIYDKSGQGNNGVGNNITSADSTKGKIKEALDFDGSSEQINLGTFNPSNPHNVTMSAWVYNKGVTSDPFANDFIIIKGHDFAVDSYGMSFSADTSINFIVYTGHPVQTCAAAYSDTKNQWYHVTGVISGTKTYLYVNGALANSCNITGTISTSAQQIWIGGQNRASYYYRFNGKIDEVMMWDRALSAAEVSQVYRYRREYLR